MIVMTDAHAGARNAASLAYIDKGAGNAKMRIFDAAAVMLVEIPFDKPCGVVDKNKLILAASKPGLIMETGTAAKASVYNGDGELAFSCDVSDSTGSAEIRLTTVSLLRGGKVALTSAVIG